MAEVRCVLSVTVHETFANQRKWQKCDLVNESQGQEEEKWDLRCLTVNVDSILMISFQNASCPATFYANWWETDWHTHTHTHTRTHTHTHTHIHTHTHARTHARAHARTHARTHTHGLITCRPKAQSLSSTSLSRDRNRLPITLYVKPLFIIFKEQRFQSTTYKKFIRIYCKRWLMCYSRHTLLFL